MNGREKKIAIVENERVTEFYIERGEQNQGIVGNIYKGRVMRVLPGMQSAFVDIGLDRDAFLYVTDFFDEEAEFERIVVDKSKKGDVEGAARAATEQIEIGRVQREQQVRHERPPERMMPFAPPLFGARHLPEHIRQIQRRQLDERSGKDPFDQRADRVPLRRHAEAADVLLDLRQPEPDDAQQPAGGDEMQRFDEDADRGRTRRGHWG